MNPALRPNGAPYASPGQRPGSRPAQNPPALKGRSKTPRPPGPRHMVFGSPLQGLIRCCPATRGAAPGWHGIAPLGRGHSTAIAETVEEDTQESEEVADAEP